MDLKASSVTADDSRAKNPAPSGREGATRRRGARLEEAILAAAWSVLTDSGYAGFTYDAVATRAGTSKPVLYRRWPQREDLLLAALAAHWPRIEIPDTGSLRSDAIGFLRAVNSDRARTIVLMNALLADYFLATGTNFGELRAALRPDQQPPFERILARAVERGDLPDRHWPPRIVNLPFDLLRHDLLMTLQPVPDSAITEIVDAVWLPLLHRPPIGDERNIR
ncbi:TetR/AcrR family transcriptional regulator [Nocardia otitidiscaviarum]|uniref:TetR/AcrR family transcriptional regulator n=1 Tax=Nocardia otitidiscaviarum TaxID=1823 RepID=UPI001895D6BD|nr:TetR/AcrR family transcriptional regulator [Nocardia otitidiscaviarum]MBF6241192.1 TetR/AcrR family transcriptional regulator [Nocardia otitidiscaviarum]